MKIGGVIYGIIHTENRNESKSNIDDWKKKILNIKKKYDCAFKRKKTFILPSL